jgi:hypothetical protein
MTPKEKAEELFEKFNNVDSPYLENYGMTFTMAKQCVLIAVDEIIRANPHSNPFNTDVHSTMEYWQEVKKEIEKL